jgi:hydrogenase nickel incorporation protein HypA/HybF
MMAIDVLAALMQSVRCGSRSEDSYEDDDAPTVSDDRHDGLDQARGKSLDGVSIRPRAGAMHKLALSQSIVALVLERARAERLRTVTRVAVAVGAAAGVDPEALRFCFDVVVEETMAREAELVIERVRLRERAARAHGRDDDAALVRTVATAHGQARGGYAGRRLGQSD